ncbi:hypothetical protein LQ772_14850 [Frateuria edaphi]|uniref:hypothetical protein n=1 Tax=Frateuria edaphi TaxID=2898793 RepID=UPI001E444BAF|nr:hypothetical protein [Frateuria edaphi]UGB45242.1 hypothetical protein LQ772_14850 [Frateuria edaphi]
MLDLVTTSFYIKAPLFKKEAFERYSTELFDEWDRHVEKHLALSDYAVTLVVEEGSIKGVARVGAAVGALYLAIGNYGSFISGMQIIREQAAYVSNTLFDEAKHRFGCKGTRGNSKQTGGEVYYLKNLFERVQRGQVTPNQAVAEVQDRWGHEASNSPQFMQELAQSLARAPRHPEQLPMADEFWEPCGEPEAPPFAPKLRRPAPPGKPVPQQYRIEIFRPKKGGLKKVKLTKL